MATKTLTERFAAPLAVGTVDREKGVISNVLVCGHKSANGRSYPWGKGLTCDPAKYEGKPVKLNHGSKGVESLLGWLENVTVDDEGRPRADLRVNPEHPHGKSVLWFAENNPRQFGLSHVAICRTRMERGTEVIEDVQEVESVDLVDSPATTQSLREGTMPTTFKKFLESVGTAKHGPRCRKWAASKIVREMDEMSGAPMDLPAPPAPDASEPDADEATTAAFKAAISAVVDKAMSGGMDPKEALAKIKTLLRSHGDINGDGAVDAADVDAADDTAEDMPPAEEIGKAESKGVEKGKALVYEAIESVKAAGLPVTRETLAVAESLPADKFQGILKTLRESRPAEKPTTTGRTTPVAESKQTTTPAAASVVGEFRRS